MPEWTELKKYIDNEIKYHTGICISLELEEREKTIAAAKIDALLNILDLHGESQDE